MSFGARARVRPGGAAERAGERSVADRQARCTGCPFAAKTSFFLATGRRHTAQRLSAGLDPNVSDTIPPDGDALVGQQDRRADDSSGEFGRKPLSCLGTLLVSAER
ncbi:hypothetical protein GCM10010389_27650 [Streptomyces echinoruber]|uniref:Uncharacterized protein n=1 Tax=Streptomyces echinoruber TaxID=68898 RepID=A0A918R6P6_9ACTN|nr:hypothetical protein GCM10010389_27650 [Streptomyces echinoruber]